MSKNNNTANYYEQDFQTSIEKAILAEDLYFTTIDNIQGKFYLPVMMPTSDIDKPVIKSNAPQKTSNYITLNIPGYMLFQFMIGSITSLQVDGTTSSVSGKNGSKMALMFGTNKFKIPKGTVFLVGFLGGEFTIEKTCIVGLLTTVL